LLADSTLVEYWILFEAYELLNKLIL
jgi:hypothetical protein